MSGKAISSWQETSYHHHCEHQVSLTQAGMANLMMRMATFYFVTRQNESQIGNHHSSSSLAQENTLLNPQGGASTWPKDIIRTRPENKASHFFALSPKKRVAKKRESQTNTPKTFFSNLVGLNPSCVLLQFHVKTAVNVGRCEAQPPVDHVNI